MMTVSEGSNP